jgi:Flp pilus assembly pilin Flp
MGRRALQWRLSGSWRRSRADERGVALIEFALVLPLILLLLFAMIDVGKAFNYWNDQTQLAGEAARYAAVNNSPTKNADGTPTAGSLSTAIKDQADSNELKNGGTSSISSPGLSICIWFPKKHTPLQPSDYAVGQPVQVVVTAEYNWLAYLVGQGLPARSTLTGRSTMRLEQPYKANGTDAFTTGPSTASQTDGSGTC